MSAHSEVTGFDLIGRVRHCGTMRNLLILCLASFGASASAQTLFDRAQGSYGSATDPATSCAANPHEMSFETAPPHLNLTWDSLKAGPPGAPRIHERYDIEGMDETSIILREEGDFRPKADGQGRFWVMQFTQTPPGYCWRRPDWPQVRCGDQQLRCEASVS